jgi:hypothetical protein
MSNWLRDKRKDSEPLTIRPEVEHLLPASVRPPDANRYTAPEGDGADDGEDEDVDFLRSLASEVDRAGSPSTGTRAAITPLRGASPRIDDMQVFRQMKDEGVVATRYDFHLTDVDLGDLLEELSTVRSALRRKAA